MSHERPLIKIPLMPFMFFLHYSTKYPPFYTNLTVRLSKCRKQNVAQRHWEDVTRAITLKFVTSVAYKQIWKPTISWKRHGEADDSSGVFLFLTHNQLVEMLQPRLIDACQVDRLEWMRTKNAVDSWYRTEGSTENGHWLFTPYYNCFHSLQMNSCEQKKEQTFNANVTPTGE